MVIIVVIFLVTAPVRQQRAALELGGAARGRPQEGGVGKDARGPRRRRPRPQTGAREQQEQNNPSQARALGAGLCPAVGPSRGR
jgi:hypothetical protein